MKNIVKSLLSIVIIIFMGITFSFGDSFEWDINPDAEFPFLDRSELSESSSWKTALWDRVDIKEHEDSIITRLLDIFNLDIIKSDDHKFLNYVKAILNIALGLLSLVALIMTIYTFFLMFFTDNEAWAKKAKWNLVGIFIALAIIGLAWLIVSFIFWRYQTQWFEPNEKNLNMSFINYQIGNNLNNQVYLTV